EHPTPFSHARNIVGLKSRDEMWEAGNLMNRNRKLMILLIVLGVLGIAIGMAYAIDVYEYRYAPDISPGGCYHKPQDVVGHVIEPKPPTVYYHYYYS
ncbi:MAG: hypothetical protein ACRD5H_12075, partial [Nitrososphaerales archaeon]